MNQPILLGVNIDHVATVRQARRTVYPDVIQAAELAEASGADGITVHLREDRRHIQVEDVEQLAKSVSTKLNLEMALTDEMLAFAAKIKPQCVCLVPEKRQELTTEGGLDVVGQKEKIREFVAVLKGFGIEVSLFIDPEYAQIQAAFGVGAPVVELHTGEYAENPTVQTLKRLKDAAENAHAHALIVNAGHGLHYENVAAIAAIPVIHELNIGHAIVAEAVMVGLKTAVSRMKNLMIQSRK